MNNRLLPLLGALIAVAGMSDVCAMHRKDNKGKKRYCPKRNRLRHPKKLGEKINHESAKEQASVISPDEQSTLDLAIARSLQDCEQRALEETLDTENVALTQQLSLEQAQDTEDLELAKAVSLSLQNDSDVLVSTQETENNNESRSAVEDRLANDLAIAQALYDNQAEENEECEHGEAPSSEAQEELEGFYSCDDDSSLD